MEPWCKPTYALVLIAVLGISGLLGISEKSLAAQAASSTAVQCTAPADYLAELKKYGASLQVDKDFSCLTDLPSLQKTLSKYQLIDTRPQHSQPHAVTPAAIKDAWVMTIAEVQHKSFLHQKPLLLLGDGFSRVNAAQDCARFKNAGFRQLKILVGGADLWSGANGVHAVNAQQLIFEYFNGRVPLVATSSAVAEQLTALGLTKYFLLENHHSQSLTDLVLNKSSHGFDAMVMVNETGETYPTLPVTFHNLYQLSGGVEALRHQLEGNVWINHNRADAPKELFCAKR
jgi:hypothetical protein